jgi:hypothetical protein
MVQHLQVDDEKEELSIEGSLLDKTVRVPSYMIHPVLALQPVHRHQLA